MLPWFALSILFIGFYSRLLRSNMLDVVKRGLRAHGAGQGALRAPRSSCATPCATRSSRSSRCSASTSASSFGGGAILTESVFGLQGVGQYAADSIGSLDLPPILGTVLYGGFFIVFLSALVDIVYAFLDPRIRLDA